MDTGNIDDRLNAYMTPQADPPKAEEPKTSPEAMPASTVEENKPDVVPEPAKVAEPEETLPEDASERTRKQFQKLQEHNKELKKQLEERSKPAEAEKPEVDYGQSVMDILKAPTKSEPQNLDPKPNVPAPTNFPYLNPQQYQGITQQFIDAEGNVDIQGLNAALQDTNAKSFQAFQHVQNLEQKLARIEENEQVREAHSQFPEIDPQRKDKFDPKLFEMVRDRLVRNMWEGKQTRLAEVVSAVKESYGVSNQKSEAETIKKFQESQQARNQGPFESGSGARQPEVSMDDLRRQTRAGGERGDKALAERLKKLGI